MFDSEQKLTDMNKNTENKSGIFVWRQTGKSVPHIRSLKYRTCELINLERCEKLRFKLLKIVKNFMILISQLKTSFKTVMRCSQKYFSSR